VNRGGRPEGVPAEERAEGERGGEAGPREGARPAADRADGGCGDGREGDDGGGAVEGSVELGAKRGEFAEESEGLLKAGDGGGVTRIGAEPLRKLAFAGGRKTVVALGEPSDGGVFEGGVGRIGFQLDSFISGTASTRPRDSK
jgi:hypothetical protein